MRTTSSDAWTDRTVLRFTHPILETHKFAGEACSISMIPKISPVCRLLFSGGTRREVLRSIIGKVKRRHTTSVKQNNRTEYC